MNDTTQTTDYRFTEKGLWVLRRMKELDPDAWVHGRDVPSERLAAVYDQALREWASVHGKT